MSDFEFDGDKSQANLEKHGIDFLDAQEFWKDPDLLEFVPGLMTSLGS